MTNTHLDERDSKEAPHLPHRDGVGCSDVIAKLVYLNGLSTECDSETCAMVGQDGMCKVPFITGARPHISSEGCEEWAVFGKDL